MTLPKFSLPKKNTVTQQHNNKNDNKYCGIIKLTDQKNVNYKAIWHLDTNQRNISVTEADYLSPRDMKDG